MTVLVVLVVGGRAAGAHLESMLPEEAQGVGEHLDGPHLAPVDGLQVRLHGEVLRQPENTAIAERCRKGPPLLFGVL